MPKNPQRPSANEPVREQSEHGTGGWKGPVKPKEDFKPAVESPAPKDHGTTKVPD